VEEYRLPFPVGRVDGEMEEAASEQRVNALLAG